MCLECVKTCEYKKDIHIYLAQLEAVPTNDLVTLFDAVLVREHNIVIQEDGK